MKKLEISNLVQFLAKIKLNKVADNDAVDALLENHLTLYKIAEATEKDIQELQKKLFEGKEEEVQKYNQLIEDGKVEQADPKMKALVIKYNKAIEKLTKEEVEVELKPIEQKTFIEILRAQEIDFNIADLIAFKRMGLVK